MSEPSHPPRPGIRRKIGESLVDDKEKRDEFRTRIDTITKCGLAAEVTVNGSWITLFATRRVRTVRGDS